MLGRRHACSGRGTLARCGSQWNQFECQQFTKSLALEFAPRKVTCNAIAPGFISTEMSNAIPDNLKEEIVKKIPLKEQGSVEDIAALTAFLASDDARYITGQVIACDGGMTM